MLSAVSESKDRGSLNPEKAVIPSVSLFWIFQVLSCLQPFSKQDMVFYDLLLPGLDRKITLGKRNLFFSGITILGDKITGITGQEEIFDPRSAPDPSETILLASTQWSGTVLPDVSQNSLAFSITFKKFLHSSYPRSFCKSRANQN